MHADVRKALEVAALAVTDELIAEVTTNTDITRAAVLAFVKAMPAFRDGNWVDGLEWCPHRIAAELAKEGGE